MGAMSGEKDRMRQAARLVRKGGAIISEPCEKCGGIQVRYHGKIYCTAHEDLSPILAAEGLSYDTVVARTREVLISRLSEAANLLESEKDVSNQDKLVSLMTKCYDLLQKLPQK
jgi:uncharacterized Zn finger protein (UPF0148 family)